MSLEAMNRPGAPVTKMAKIGLWGATSSGKTTFLAALYVAANQSQGKWNIIGVDQPSVDFLVDNTQILTKEQRFPSKTEGIQEYSWTIMGETERVVKHRWRKRTESVPLHFQLDLIDASGRLFRGKEKDRAEEISEELEDIELDFDDPAESVGESGDAFDRLVNHLTECDGIVYLFDPLRENKDGDEFHYFQQALQNVTHRCMQNGRLAGRHLPHYLAVCITKLDSPKVFHTAHRRGYLTFDPDDPYLFPRVREDKAEDLFRELCHLSPTRSALQVHDAIKTSFAPERVRYFATSAVGFYLSPTATRFQASSFQNVIPHPTQPGEYTIRGDIHPINVLEPLLWLGQVTRR